MKFEFKGWKMNLKNKKKNNNKYSAKENSTAETKRS